MRANSLFRALRVDRLTYAALEGTLLAYVRRDHDSIPALRMMRLSKAEIGKRAEAIAGEIQSATLRVELIDGNSVIGGGAAPSAVLPTRLLAISHKDLSADELAARLRASDPYSGRHSLFSHVAPPAALQSGIAGEVLTRSRCQVCLDERTRRSPQKDS